MTDGTIQNDILFSMTIINRKTIEDYITSLISEFEDEHYPIQDVSPVEVLRHQMENHGHKQGDLTDCDQ